MSDKVQIWPEMALGPLLLPFPHSYSYLLISPWNPDSSRTAMLLREE